MNALLIQPPDNHFDIPGAGIDQGDLDTFSPPWELMSLRAYMQKHTRHVCTFIDCRLMADLERELTEQIDRHPPPRIAVVHASLMAFGQVDSVLEIIKRRFPTIRTVLFGDLPSAFPEEMMTFPRTDFALAGDPEPILRNLLDYVDMEPRLRRTPGLVIPSQKAAAPYWLPKLNSLPLPTWDDYFWLGYKQGALNNVCRAAIRLTRGSARQEQNRLWGEQAQPLRVRPLAAMAALVSRCAHTEVRHLHLDDPPAFWTEVVLDEWIRELIHARNVQPWGATVFPMPLREELILTLRESGCQRLDFVFPSCDRDRLHDYGIHPDWKLVRDTFRGLQDAGIAVIPRFYIGGPGEASGEASRVAQWIKRFRFFEYRIEPFPYRLDAPVFADRDDDLTPSLHDWLNWSRDPWVNERPVPLWGGAPAQPRIQATVRAVQRTLHKNPRRAWQRIRRGLLSTNWIAHMENRALQFMQRHRKPSG